MITLFTQGILSFDTLTNITDGNAFVKYFFLTDYLVY